MCLFRIFRWVFVEICAGVGGCGKPLKIEKRDAQRPALFHPPLGWLLDKDEGITKVRGKRRKGN